MLHFGENSRMALETVRDHKTRSFLTVLGVVIGVAAMIFVASILVGVSRDVQGYLDDYGTNTLFIFRWDIGHSLRPHERGRAHAQAADSGRRQGHPGRVSARQERDRRSVSALQSRSSERPGALRVARYGSTGNHQPRLQRRQLRPTRMCTTRTCRKAASSPSLKTRTAMDVAVIGDEIDKNFFPAHDGIGKTISGGRRRLSSHRRAGKAQGPALQGRDRRPRGQSSLQHLSQALSRQTTSTSSAPRPIPVTRMPPKMKFADCCAAAAMCPSISPTISA